MPATPIPPHNHSTGLSAPFQLNSKPNSSPQRTLQSSGRILYINDSRDHKLRDRLTFSIFSASNISFESEQKQKFQITKLPFAHKTKNTAQLWIISALVANNWSHSHLQQLRQSMTVAHCQIKVKNKYNLL